MADDCPYDIYSEDTEKDQEEGEEGEEQPIINSEDPTENESDLATTVEVEEKKPVNIWQMVFVGSYSEALEFVEAVTAPPDKVQGVRWSLKPYRAHIRKGTLVEHFYCRDGGRHDKKRPRQCYSEYKLEHGDPTIIWHNSIAVILRPTMLTNRGIRFTNDFSRFFVRGQF